MLPLDLPGFQINRFYTHPDQLIIYASAISSHSACPACGFLYYRVHSYYLRRAKDLSVMSQSVQLYLLVRRFRCINSNCPKQAFTEPLPQLLALHARRTSHLSTALKELGIVLSAQTAAKAAAKLKMPPSYVTILRTLKALRLAEVPSAIVLDVEDFAFRKGQTYDTLLIDIEKPTPINLIPDRTVPTLYIGSKSTVVSKSCVEIVRPNTPEQLARFYRKPFK